jgi:predicted PurR-regulated permease PerM
MRHPTRFQQQTIWNALTGISILVLGALLVGLVWLLGEIFGFLQPVLIPLIVAGIIAYLLDPLVRWLEKRGITRLWSVVLVFLGILVAVTLLVLAILPGIQRGSSTLRDFIKPEVKATTPVDASPTITEEESEAASTERQLGSALASSIHELRTKHRSGPLGWALTETTDEGEPITYLKGTPTPEDLEFFWRTRAGRVLFKYQGEILQTGKNWISTGSTKVLGFIGLVLGMIMVPVYLFFFLKDSASIRSHWHDYVPLKASRFKTELVSTLQEINRYLISFFRGQVLVAAIDGILVGIALQIYGLPYGFMIGVFMAILGVVPYIGNIICLIPACIIAYLHGQHADLPFDMSRWAYVGGVVVIFVVVQQINSLVTAPKIVGDSVGLHPLTVIFSMLFWSLVLGGFVGALLAVPLTAAVKVLFRRYIWERQLRDYPESSY